MLNNQINKVILVVIDGLSYEMKRYMGYLEALCYEKKSSCYRVKSGYPSLSRPLYEEILTGVSPIESGIVNNEIKRKSKEESIFSLAIKNGKTTGAAAYYWIEELYNSGGFDPIAAMEVENIDGNINYGRFYWEDNYPDSHVFAQGEIIRKRYNSDFLLIHSMNVDYAGHKFGGNSKEYIYSAMKVSDIISKYMPTWIEEGYQIIVTADHGMNENGLHGGTDSVESEVPMWIVGDIVMESGLEETVSQRKIAPLCCKGLGIERSKRMVSLDE
ncbi:hypothetical protein IX317_001210 [Fusobacterium sp. DD29]|uniref:alkaline phosphatase family protein n=1 Tax=unclassified Fusobacterium TaxID=2648384 RepID=UPI001D8D4EAC|nr:MULTISPECIES: alkaline phosphatase family protein [unclassified Fusobacterium]MBR8702053.1 hypothetical protein [Fusobacterium sp. DD45]MBR8711867.1 hypothetical protein [Fusobacterium sp. DD28]MBR8749536.1 hypothetical protein [Fusobacterium sp. DD29]MBR8752428.1 hypothetical protein [Fusobacterium sp. DD26]MBR8761797.1 hypothetical protein [Fusobacterium sp. DD25]